MACSCSYLSAGFCHHKTEVLPYYEIIISVLHALTGDFKGDWTLIRILGDRVQCGSYSHRCYYEIN